MAIETKNKHYLPKFGQGANKWEKIQRNKFEICILTEKMLQDFNIYSKSIKKNCQNLNVVTSNQVSQNCILGTICLDIWVVLDNGKKTMAKCPETLFYVANSEIILQYPILGTNFLQKNKSEIEYRNLTEINKWNWQIIFFKANLYTMDK